MCDLKTNIILGVSFTVFTKLFLYLQAIPVQVNYIWIVPFFVSQHIQAQDVHCLCYIVLVY